MAKNKSVSVSLDFSFEDTTKNKKVFCISPTAEIFEAYKFVNGFQLNGGPEAGYGFVLLSTRSSMARGTWRPNTMTQVASLIQ